jgi:hypothetical protein
LNGEVIPDDWHITISIKNPTTEKSKMHRTIHGYTAGKKSYELVSSSATGIKPDWQRNTWPKACDLVDYKQETHIGNPDPARAGAGLDAEEDGDEEE